MPCNHLSSTILAKKLLTFCDDAYRDYELECLYYGTRSSLMNLITTDCSMIKVKLVSTEREIKNWAFMYDDDDDEDGLYINN